MPYDRPRSPKRIAGARRTTEDTTPNHKTIVSEESSMLIDLRLLCPVLDPRTVIFAKNTITFYNALYAPISKARHH